MISDFWFLNIARANLSGGTDFRGGKFALDNGTVKDAILFLEGSNADHKDGPRK